MIRRFSWIILSIISFSAPNLYAVEQDIRPQGINLEYELPANNPQVFINYMFWTIEAKCTMKTPDSSNDLLVEALAKKGKLNGQEIKAGQSLVVTIHNGELIRLSADSGAKVQITNLGKSSVIAQCKS